MWSTEQDLQLDFSLQNFFLFGSPLACFVSLFNDESYVRSSLPTCRNFYNIYHPLDFVAYRLEPLIKFCSYEISNDGIILKNTDEAQ